MTLPSGLEGEKYVKLQDLGLFRKGENFKPSFLGQGVLLRFLGLQGL